MASIFNNIGNIHLIGERYEEAIENYRKAVESKNQPNKNLNKFIFLSYFLIFSMQNI